MNYPQIKYASFIDEYNKYFNLVSNRDSENPYVFNVPDANLIIFDEKGILIEIELLFIHPIYNYPSLNLTTQQAGFPLFNTKYFKEKNQLFSPLLFIEKKLQKALIQLDENLRDIDLMINQDQINFLFKQDKLIAIECLNITLDYDDIRQSVWLDQNLKNS